MAVLLVRAMGTGELPPRGIFEDVQPAAFGAGFIERLAQLGITAGCGGGNFCPDAPLTRAQAAVFIIRALGESPVNPPTGIFADVPVNSPFAGFIERLAQLGITAGCGGGNFCPNAPTTRAQAAVFLARAFAIPL